MSSSHIYVGHQVTVWGTVGIICAHPQAAQVKAAASTTLVSLSELWVTDLAVTELDRTAGVGHKPPRRLSGTFLQLFWSQKS